MVETVLPQHCGKFSSCTIEHKHIELYYTDIVVEKEGRWGAKSRIYMLALEIDIPCPVSQSDSESISEEHNQNPSNKVLQWAEFEIWTRLGCWGSLGFTNLLYF